MSPRLDDRPAALTCWATTPARTSVSKWISRSSTDADIARDPLGIDGSARRRVPHRHDRHHLGCRQPGPQALEMADQGHLLGGMPKRVLRGQQHPDPVVRPRRRMDRVAMPALLATAAIHHHLVRQGLRMQTGLVVETGEAREVAPLRRCSRAMAPRRSTLTSPFETLESIRVAA